MDYPKISIITPSYNQGRFIEEAILSVKNQGYPNFEHIIIDGGSTDETLDVLKRYPHLIWVSEPDRGQSDALNKGFKMATGEIIGWLNSDDYFLDEAFEKVITFFQQHPDADMIYGNYYFVDEHRNILKAMRILDFDLNLTLYYGCYMPTSGSFFHRRVFQEGDYLDVDFHYIMDGEFLVRLGLKGRKLQHIPEFLSCFRWHGDNKSIRYKRLPTQERMKARRKQLEEGIRLRRRYGRKFTSNVDLNEKIYKILWRYYRIVFIVKKLLP